MKLTPSQRRYIRRKSRAPESDPAAESDELNIVPFLDVVVNLIMFLLLTMTAVLTVAEVRAQLPSYGPGEPQWSATVVLTEGGVVVSDGQGTVAPGCDDYGSGPTIANVGGEPDWLALRACAEKLHAAHPDSERVTIAADPMIPLAQVIRAMDAVRGANDSLFSDVKLAAGVR